MKKENIFLLSKTFLLDGIEESTYEELFDDLNVEERHYSKGEVIYSPSEFERKVGFVTSGECLIARAGSTEHPVPINIAKHGDSFGITSVFSSHDNFPTLITAKTVCSVFFINSEDLMKLMQKNHTISLNVIRFLTERIEFLNERIATFSGMTVEEKLVSYIISLHKKYASDEFEFNKKRSAEAISCGRASLYRAMDAISSTGCVKFDNKKIYINDLQGLERMSK